MNMEDRQKDVDPPQQCEHGYLTIGDDECPVCHQIGMQEIRNNQIKEASEQHFYWFNEACNALDRMRAIAFNMATQDALAFSEAKKQFDLTRSRCKVEFEILHKAMVARLSGHETDGPELIP